MVYKFFRNNFFSILQFNQKMKLLSLLTVILFFQGCKSGNTEKDISMKKIRLVVLDPGHFHAALVQKSMYNEMDSTVDVFAPAGPDVENYLRLVNSYNTRTDNPTNWNLNVYKGDDYFSRSLSEKPGVLVMLAGNNKNKSVYIKKSVDAGFNVLSDKPMAITAADFALLDSSFNSAEKSHVLLYDIMTSRYDVTNIIEKELSENNGIFGEVEKGTQEDPAIIKQSTHYFYKTVSGAPLVRPAWFFDTEQEGDGIVDVTTHLVDLVQWENFPEQILNYEKDINVLSAKRWSTPITLPQFSMVTKVDSFPPFLSKDIKNKILNVYSNGELNYAIKGVHAKISVSWGFQAPEGSSDTYFSRMRGTKANLIIRQDKEQQFKPTLYIEPVDKKSIDSYEKVLAAEFKKIEEKFPRTSLKKVETGWEVNIPEKYKIDHEQQFALLTKTFLDYLLQGKMPEWEIAFMKAKYYTTTKAFEIALKKN